MASKYKCLNFMFQKELGEKIQENIYLQSMVGSLLFQIID